MRIAQRFNVMKQILMAMAFLLVAIMMTSLWVGRTRCSAARWLGPI
jgi:hypothetical protein